MIQTHEKRYSVTQYAAGALFRWVDHGCSLDKVFFADLTSEAALNEERRREGRKEFGLSLFSMIDGLQSSMK